MPRKTNADWERELDLAYARGYQQGKTEGYLQGEKDAVEKLSVKRAEAIVAILQESSKMMSRAGYMLQADQGKGR